MNQKRLNIGLYVTEFSNTYTRAMCEGAAFAAKEIDANLFVFPGKYIEAPYKNQEKNKYVYQFNSLFSYANLSEFDIVLVDGSITANIDLDRRKEFLSAIKVPVISLAAQVEGYPCVHFDNKAGLTDGIQHLISKCGCTQIGFISGPLTSDDAKERYDVYKEVLEKNQIPYDETKVGYGNFSEYCQPQVETILDAHPDLQAIVFANDTMALGGYEVFNRRGLAIGKDIKVLGFDDAPFATTLKPTLSTIRADATKLGYLAVVSIPDFLSKRIDDMVVNSFPVYRNSTGESNDGYAELAIDKESFISDEKLSSVFERINQYLFGQNNLQAGAQPIKEVVAKYVFLTRSICKGDASKENISKLERSMSGLIREKLEPYTDLQNIYYLFGCMYDLLCQSVTSNEQLENIAKMYIEVYQESATISKLQYNEQKADVGWMNHITTTFTRDILNYEIGDERTYRSIVEKLAQVFYQDAYMCLFEKCILHEEYGEEIIPDSVLLKSYLKDEQHYSVEPDQQKISTANLFLNFYKNLDRRVTVVSTLLFSALEQYGIIIGEISEEYFAFTEPIAYQISAAVKTIQLLASMDSVTKQLESSLEQIKESNMILDELSKSDELTQIYNRRGFLTTVQHQLTHEKNLGKKAVMIYADMNNLKIINDQFGHEEGDYSLKTIANILKETFDDGGIVGRFGGDEFVAFKVIEDPQKDTIANIRQKVTEITKVKNDSNDKPYYISMSVGISQFVCKADTVIQDLIDTADVDLYMEKKHKRKNIMK